MKPAQNLFESLSISITKNAIDLCMAHKTCYLTIATHLSHEIVSVFPRFLQVLSPYITQ